MGSRQGPSWLSFGKVLGYLYRMDAAACDIAKHTGLDPKTVFGTLRSLCNNGLVVKLHTGERNKVRYHLSPKNYWKAMELISRKLEWPKKLPRKVQEFHEYAADKNAKAMNLLNQIPLSPKAKEYLVREGWTGQLILETYLQSLREGSFCLGCMNSGQGFQPTFFDPETHVYVCQKCGVEQEALQEGNARRKRHSRD